MNVELDHLFICTSCGGAEAELLKAIGLTEGTPNTHPGQGTACRRFFFHNGYIELLWVNDESDAQSVTTQPMHLWERWSSRNDGACPFGLGFRPGKEGVPGAPFPAWEYRPQYLPASWSFQIATNSAILTEPMMFYLPFSRRSDSHPAARKQPLEHVAGLREITGVELVSPHMGGISPALEAVLMTGAVRVRSGTAYAVEVTFDGGLKGKTADFRPGLPMVFRW